MDGDGVIADNARFRKSQMKIIVRFATNLHIFLLLLGLCTSCMPVQETPNPTETASIVISPTAAGKTETLSVHQTPQQPVITPSNMPDASPNYPISEQCLNVVEDFPQGEIPSGKLVLSDRNAEEDVRSYIYDFQTGEKIYLADLFGVSVSPDQRRFAYYNLDTKATMIVDNHGNQLRTVDNPQELLSSEDWLSDDYLTMLKFRPVAESDYEHEVETLILLNVNTGEEVEIPHDRYPVYPNLRAGGRYPLFISPQMDLVFFPIDEDRLPAVLYDIEKERIRKYVYNFNYDVAPKWSPDGSRIIIYAVANSSDDQYDNVKDNLPCIWSELLELSTSGEIKRLTCISEKYTIHSFLWSPDQQKIGMTLFSFDKSEYHPAILDLATNQVTVLCNIGNFTDWGSNSDHFLYRHYDHEASIDRLYYAGFKENYAVMIGEDFIEAHWLND